MTTLTIDWTEQLSEQLEWHWSRQLRPRFAGLSDDEYLWEPAQPAWNVRPRTGDGQPGTGPFTVEFAFPEPDPPPVTTIAWRLAHVIVGVLGARVASHFGGPPVDYGSFAVRGHGRRGTGPAGRRLRGLDGGRPRSRRGGARPAVRPGGGAVRRVPDGRARAAHQPGGDPPRGGGRAAARPVPGSHGGLLRPRAQRAKWSHPPGPPSYARPSTSTAGSASSAASTVPTRTQPNGSREPRGNVAASA